MIKYRTGGYSKYSKNMIDEVEIERETDSSVWIRGRRSAKRSEYHNYYDSWSDARNALLSAAEDNVARARRSLEMANSRLGNIKGMKAP